MSMPQLLSLLDGALKDPATGLAATVLLLAGDDARIRADFNHIEWAMIGTLNDARTPNIMMRPRRWLASSRATDAGHRDADAQIDIGYEYFGTDKLAIQDNVSIVATALAQVIDGLRAYSELHGGTLIDVADPVLYDFGQFEGPTSHGFLATLTLTERSTQ